VNLFLLNFFCKKVNVCNFFENYITLFFTYSLKGFLDITNKGVCFFYVSSNEKDAECQVRN
jgi:hypothetical protein